MGAAMEIGYTTDRSVYRPNDFVAWRESQTLVITPKFQRRAVWKAAARSYFIDTMLRGMTVPPLYLRLNQNVKKTKVVREVIDGQQRVRSVLDFVRDQYRLSKSVGPEWQGKKFSQL